MAYNLLKGKKGIITGALDENSIAWKVALKAKEEGATFILTNAPVALRMGKINELAKACDTEVIPADATKIEDIEALYQQSMEKLGGKLDFVLHSIGMSPNVRKGRDYGNLNYDWFLKSLDISALSFHKMLQVAEKQDALNEYASVLGLSYIAAQRTFDTYGDMAQAKAVLESIARSYGARYGMAKKVRINTISQSPTQTTAGTGIRMGSLAGARSPSRVGWPRRSRGRCCTWRGSAPNTTRRGAICSARLWSIEACGSRT